MPIRSPRVHVVVLAAGRGSRLGAVGDDRPKWLLEVGGRTLADRHLEGIGACDAVATTTVVTGHAAEAVAQAVAARPEAIDLVHVPEYAERNNWWSLLSALRVLPTGEAVAVVNSDLCADPAAITAFLDEVHAGDDDGVLAVDLARTLTDESMKVAVDAHGALSRIGKVDVEDPVGEYVGLLYARGEARGALEAALGAFEGRPEAANEWYEGAVGRSAASGTAWTAWPMPSTAWVEIDDDADLAAAEALVEVA